MSARIERVSTRGEAREHVGGDARGGRGVGGAGRAALRGGPHGHAHGVVRRVVPDDRAGLDRGPARTRKRPHLAPGLALLWGFGAVAVAANASGSPVPLPWSAAALPLSLLAAVAEEALFRRLAFARLEPFGAAVAIVGSAMLFGLVHVPAYGLSALPVDVGAGLLLRVAAVGLGDLDGPGRDACGRQRAGGAPMRRAAVLVLALAMFAGVSCTSSSPEPIRIGAVYPLSGAQGPGGVDEFDGVRLAVQLVNADGGVGGRPIELVPVDTPSADAAPGAIAGAPRRRGPPGVRELWEHDLGAGRRGVRAPEHAVLGDGRGGRDDRPGRRRARVPRRPLGRDPGPERDRVRGGRVRPGDRRRPVEAPVRGHARGRRVRTRRGPGRAR